MSDERPPFSGLTGKEVIDVLVGKAYADVTSSIQRLDTETLSRRDAHIVLVELSSAINDLIGATDMLNTRVQKLVRFCETLVEDEEAELEDYEVDTYGGRI
jgi:hypothetical protein